MSLEGLESPRATDPNSATLKLPLGEGCFDELSDRLVRFDRLHDRHPSPMEHPHRFPHCGDMCDRRILAHIYLMQAIYTR